MTIILDFLNFCSDNKCIEIIIDYICIDLIYPALYKEEMYKNCLTYLLGLEKYGNSVMFKIALIYEKEKKYKLAKNYYYKNILYYKSNKTLYIANSSLNNMGFLYEKEKNYIMALKFYVLAYMYGNDRAFNNTKKILKLQHNTLKKMMENPEDIKNIKNFFNRFI